MHQYKLIYFNARGRAELLRWIFEQTGTPYEDYRLDSKTAEWLKVKPTTPCGQVPVLEIDGKMYGQSIALARFLAKELGLEASTPEGEARADMIVNCLEDTVNGTGPIFFEKDAAKKEELRAKFIEKIKPQMAMLEKLLIQNGGGDGWMVGDKLTWADLAVTIYTESWIQPIGVEPEWENYPKLDALRKKVLALPRIADWLKRQPQTTM